MTTDYHALCAEQLPELRGMFERILCIARSSGGPTVGNIQLADRLIDAVVSWFQNLPAQLESDELPPGYIDPEHKGQDRELLEVFYRACRSEGGTADEIHLRGLKAVLALAQPEPVGLTDEGRELQWPPSVALGCHQAAVEAEPGSPLQQLLIAAGDLLESRFAQPTLAPIPVSERPWEREGFCDAEGRCWLFGKIEGDWRLISANNSGVPKLSYCFSHCLPHYALPLPAAPGEGE
jgi:hypothetical protein